MISAEYFSIFFTVVVQSSAVWPAVSRPEVLTGYRIMLGIKDEVLHVLLISHFLLLCLFLILILMFAIFLPVIIPGYRRERGGWFAGAVRSPDPSCFPPGPSLVKRVVGQKLTRKIVSNCDLQWPWSETVRYRGSHQQVLSVSTGSIQTRTQYTGKNSQITYQSL